MTPAQTKILEWRTNPLQFVREVLFIEPDAWQADALQTLAGSEMKPRRRLVMKSCTGAGKSSLLAWVGWHRLLCFADKGEHPKGAAISGEGSDNLRDNLFAELSKWRERSPLLKAAFTWTAERIYATDFKETWFLSARSYAKDADSDAIGRSLSGLHSKYPFILFDEIGDAPIQLGQKAEQIFTGGVKDGLIACAGNPTSTTGLLYSICIKERANWDVITITADPEDPKRTPRVDIEHARQQIKLHGRNNPWVQSTILGEFPETGFNSLLSVKEVEDAMSLHLTEDKYIYSQKRLGVDCARFGSDATIIFPRQGLAAFQPVVMRNARSNEIAARVAIAKNKWGSEVEFVDSTGGWGSGVVDSLLQAGHSPIEVNFSASSPDERYFNLRSYLWFMMAEWVKRGGALPYIPELLRELTTPTYTFQSGKFRLEEKDQIKRRLGFSPDYADALCTSFFFPDQPGKNPHDPMSYLEAAMGQHSVEFDPFRD